jgi:hypothetical protein
VLKVYEDKCCKCCGSFAAGTGIVRLGFGGDPTATKVALATKGGTRVLTRADPLRFLLDSGASEQWQLVSRVSSMSVCIS